jgi:glycosyltransferase involved in cell wall biosynthesis
VRLAYFSPLAPKRTGIATYSAHLGRALADLADLDFFDPPPSLSPLPGRPVLDYIARPELLLGLERYDGVLYHLGNNPHYHLDIYRALLQAPGVVVLHDTVLYYLIAGLSRGGMLREFGYNYGAARLDEFFAIERDSPDGNVLRYRQPERYPFLARILATATAVIVHSETSAQLVRAAGAPRGVHVVPLLAYPSLPVEPGERARIRAEFGIADDTLLLGCFGFIGATKRMGALLAGLARLRSTRKCALLVVGEGESLARDIAAHGVGDCVIHPGFVDDERFDLLLRNIDVLVNLRYPSMGETSATLIQAMARAIPAVVSDHAWFAELPDEVVWKIGAGRTEVDELVAALDTLAGDSARCTAIAAAARRYVQARCAPAVVATQYINILAALRRLRAPRLALDRRTRPVIC